LLGVDAVEKLLGRREATGSLVFGEVGSERLDARRDTSVAECRPGNGRQFERVDFEVLCE